MDTTFDIRSQDEGTITLFWIRTDAGQEWVDAHLPEDVLRFGVAYVAEHRYAQDIIDGMRSDGLLVRAT